jgi:DNA processing protein
MKNREYNWLKLLNALGFGAKSIYYIYNCLDKAGLPINVLFDLGVNELQTILPEIGKGRFSKASLLSLKNLDEDKIFDQYEKLRNEKVHIIGLGDDRYPRSVIEKLQDNAPAVLFCKGYLPLLNTKGISIIGSRNITDFAVTITKRIANRLAENGYNVTSGYAKGVDTSAHLGALEAGGTTTMILSFGANHISIKKDLKEFDWEKNTLFVTQFLPFEKFSGQNAMIRNKLVCAMSQAVIVICSGPEKDTDGKTSGTFDAGKSALKMGIPLFVLSPEILKPTPQGNLDLIKIGGIPLTNGNELISYLDNLNKKVQEPVNGQDIKASETKAHGATPQTASQLLLNF